MKRIMKRILLINALLFLCFILLSCATYHKVNRIDRIYLSRVSTSFSFINVKKEKLPEIKVRIVDYISKYSNMKLQILSDTLISTKSTDGKSEIIKKQCRNFGYIVTIKLIDNKYKVKVNCYTTDKYKSKYNRAKYETIIDKNIGIFIHFLETGEIKPKYINDPKEYDTMIPKGEAAIDLD